MAKANKPLVIAIDGPAGSGKSTVSKLVAKRLGLLYLDTGAMYRALTLKAMQQGVDLQDGDALAGLAEKTDISLAMNEKADAIKVYLDRKDVTYDIRTPEVTENIKYIAKVPGVRKHMVKIQRSIGEKAGAVLEGRDTTTVVFPDADYKFYLDADLKERALRRFKEMQAMGMKASLKDVEEDAEKRDISDKTRKVGALKIAEDAIRLDTTNLTIEQVVDRILSEIG